MFKHFAKMCVCMSQVPLLGAGGSRRRFKCGEVQEFSFMGPDVGYVYSVNLRLEPTKKDPAWHCDYIELTNKDTGSSSTFHYANWLNASNPSATVSRTSPMTEYTVRVVTGAVNAEPSAAAADTNNSTASSSEWDGEVYLCLTGVSGSTDETLLVSDTPGFKVFTGGSSEVFRVKGADVGTLTASTLRLVPTGTARHWQLARLEVEQSGTSADAAAAAAPAAAVFLQTSLLEVPPLAKELTLTIQKQLPVAPYKVTVSTGNVEDTSFMGQVYITISGMNGMTQEVQLVFEGNSVTGEQFVLLAWLEVDC